MSGSIAPFIEGLIRASEERTCTTCRYYAYLTTLGSHICHAPECSGIMTEQEVKNTEKYPCDAWQPREAE